MSVDHNRIGMPAVSCLLLACLAACSLAPGFHPGEKIPLRVPRALVVSSDQSPGDMNTRAYLRAFEAMGLKPGLIVPSELKGLASAREQLVLAVPARTAHMLSAGQVDQLLGIVESGAVLISEEFSPLSERVGFKSGTVAGISSLQEMDHPQVAIQWEHPARLAPPLPPSGALVLCKEAASGAPMASLIPHGKGQVLMLGAELDPEKGEGYTRFPFLPQELIKAGVAMPFREERLSALFDWGYRRNADLDALARQWRMAGIRAIHAGAWAFYDGFPAQDKYLETMIAACHRNGILVFAWLELPHVSEKFWDEHPEWREKTALGEDAQLDWRFLMNLEDPGCYGAVTEGLGRMMSRFDWDGANSGEVYYDSPSGPTSPDLFTPLNATVRTAFKARHGIDPVEFFRPASTHFWKRDQGGWRAFVDYRVRLERDLNERILRELSRMKNASQQPLGLAITYVDDLYDTRMREAVGADVRLMMPLLGRYDFTLIMEDPGTVWHLGPRRYTELASSYSKITTQPRKLGIDINIVERNTDAYPTKKQTGVEFLQLFYNAARSFETVMVYSEQTIYDWDLPLVANAMAADVTAENLENEIRLSSPRPLVYRSGQEGADFQVNGRDWPCAASGDVLLPAGTHRVAAFARQAPPRPRLISINADLLGASYGGKTIVDFGYRARPKGAAIFDRSPRSIEVDGIPIIIKSEEWILLPGGEHRVRVFF